MGRKSVAEKIIESLEDDEGGSSWIVCYDFQVNTHLRRFYKNRGKIISELGGNMVQYSVFLGPVKASNALHDLAMQYGAVVIKYRLEDKLEKKM